LIGAAARTQITRRHVAAIARFTMICALPDP
jgi:hypothetical protein